MGNGVSECITKHQEYGSSYGFVTKQRTHTVAQNQQTNKKTT